MRGELRRPGLTLVELLVILVVVAGLCFAAVTWFQTSRESARRTQCFNNLRQIGLALENYESANGAFPMGYVGVRDEEGRAVGTGWGWQAVTLPYMEQVSLYNAINFYLPVADPAERTVRTVTINAFLCPNESDPVPVVVHGAGQPGRVIVDDLARSAYVGSAGSGKLGPAGDPGGIFFRSSSVTRRGVADGMATTLFAGERSRALADAAWAGVVAGSEVCARSSGGTGSSGACAPADALALGTADPAGLDPATASAANFAGAHGDGGFFLFGEASVRFIRRTMDPEVFRAMTTRAGGESIKLDGF